MNQIQSSEITTESLPSASDRDAVFAFAMSFNGYEHFGSFQAAAENARSRSRSSLIELQNELFMSARASRHCNDDEFLNTYNELLPLFKAIINQGGAT
jgi:hypothetical protein